MMMKWIMAAVVCYGGIVALLYVGQRSLQYFPERRRVFRQTRRANPLRGRATAAIIHQKTQIDKQSKQIKVSYLK